MKTTLLAILAIAAALAPARLPAQGTVFLNNYDSRAGIYLYSDEITPAPLGTHVEVLGGPNPYNLYPLLTSAGAGPVFTITAAGLEAFGPGSGSYFDAGYGAVPGVPSSGMAFFEVLAWWGADSFVGADLRGFSPVWSQGVGTADTGPPPTPGLAVPLKIPVWRIDLWVPEPSTTALAGLGLAGLLVLRRREERASREAAGNEATQRERKPK